MYKYYSIAVMLRLCLVYVLCAPMNMNSLNCESAVVVGYVVVYDYLSSQCVVS